MMTLNTFFGLTNKNNVGSGDKANNRRKVR